MTTMKWLFLFTLAGHMVCGVCDCLMTYLPNGRFKFDYMKDNRKLAEVFKSMPTRRAILSTVLGCLAMCMMFFGYMPLYLWMKPISQTHARLMLVSIGLIFLFGPAHHVLCGVPEWLYVRLGRTEDARQVIVELFKKTSVTMFACYAGFLIWLEATLQFRHNALHGGCLRADTAAGLGVRIQHHAVDAGTDAAAR